MDWDKWAEDIFDNSVAGIKETDPITHPLEWKFFWEMLGHWRTFKENKAKDRENKNED